MMSESDREYNLRQYNLMLRAIQGYEDSSIKLSDLVGDLEALNSALQNPTGTWLSEFEPAWGKLEDVYAVMLDEGRTELNGVEISLIENAINRLKSLIRSEIAKS